MSSQMDEIQAVIIKKPPYHSDLNGGHGLKNENEMI
jgi:hypothetical protein